MLKQFCLRARRCKLTKSWPFWCHGDSHGKASHGRMDSSCVHYAMWGDHSSTQRGYSYKYCLTCLLNCYVCLSWNMFESSNFRMQCWAVSTSQRRVSWFTWPPPGTGRVCVGCDECVVGRSWCRIDVALRTSWDVVLANGFTKDLSSLSSWIFFSTRLG